MFHYDHPLLLKQSTKGILTIVFYVDDIISTIYNKQDTVHFVTKKVGHFLYFSGFEVSRNKKGVVLSQRKYVTDLLEETILN